ncbi:MAG: hypothetical protein CXX69_05220 [Candidatus Thalassarchaeum betae]|uniref:Uncharacterized protein n=1 Tax=Candidatus Thalassarchaeum betae TaxID=2599289 RepID=A0A2V3HQH2_9ARCH|nr:MAG: hypothetical protein CXX69_05220 [Candidatus Thalassoarchaea betae]
MLRVTLRYEIDDYAENKHSKILKNYSRNIDRSVAVKYQPEQIMFSREQWHRFAKNDDAHEEQGN